jgi:hypothetical protein
MGIADRHASRMTRIPCVQQHEGGAVADPAIRCSSTCYAKLSPVPRTKTSKGEVPRHAAKIKPVLEGKIRLWFLAPKCARRCVS